MYGIYTVKVNCTRCACSLLTAHLVELHKVCMQSANSTPGGTAQVCMQSANSTPGGTAQGVHAVR